MQETPVDGDADEPAVEAVRHLHAAALEVLAAARSFLDAAEELAGDPERLRAVGATLSGLVSDVSAAGSAGRRGSDPPWTAGVSKDDVASPEDDVGSPDAPDEPAGPGTEPPASTGDAVPGRIRRIPLQ